MNCPDCSEPLKAGKCKCGYGAEKKKAANEDELLPLIKRPCAYCGAPPVATVNGRSHCREHAYNAMDNITPLGSVKSRA